MKRWLVMLAVGSLIATACRSGGDDKAAPSTATSSVVTSVTSVVADTQPPATSAPTTTAQTAAEAIIEPNAVAAIPLGASKSEAIAVLGTPTTSGQDTDVGGKTYDFLRWQFSGNRGLFLNFRTESATSPRLTDWTATAPGPATTAGVQVGDDAAKVTAAHGPLEPFCCESQVASVLQGGGRMIVVVANADQKVTQIIGGDPAFWSRSIAD